jgi:flagellar biosynthesis protein FlhG
MRRSTQEEELIRHRTRGPVKVIAVASGKGGVGKTNVAANIAVALAGMDKNVMLLDADVSLANVDVLLGLQPRFNLSHLVKGETDLDSTIVEGPKGVRIIPASSGDFSMTDLPSASHAAIINAFGELVQQPDTLVVDTSAGISQDVARYVQAAQECVVVVCDEPSSITDAYALIKVFSRNYGIEKFQVVTNQTVSSHDGRQLFDKISRVAEMYLDVVLRHLGNVPHDGYLKRSVQEQRAVVDAYPKSASGQAFFDVAQKLDRLPCKTDANGGLQFFFERILASGRETGGCYV